jgi:hypothetical protein
MMSRSNLELRGAPSVHEEFLIASNCLFLKFSR